MEDDSKMISWDWCERVGRLFLLLVVFVALLAGRGFSLERVDPQVRRELAASGDQAVVVLVLLKPPSYGPDASWDARRRLIHGLQESVLEALDDGEFRVAYRYLHFPLLAGAVTGAGLDVLERHALVAGVGHDAEFYLQLDNSAPFLSATELHADFGITGEGVAVAVMDTGVDTDHPDLEADLLPDAMTFNEQGNVVRPGAEDPNGHGTAVTGIITSDGVVAPPGIAPDAKVLVYDIFSSDDIARAVDLVAAYDHAVGLKTSGNSLYTNLVAVNLSLGTNPEVSCP